MTSPLRDLLDRPLRGRIIALIIVAVLAAAVAWYVGMDWWHACVIATAVAAIGLIWMAIPDRPPTVWPLESHRKDDGNRNDVNRLSWSLRTRRRRVRPEAVRRIRRLADARLEPFRTTSEQSLDIDDPADRASIERLIGSRAYATLRSNPVRLPTFGDIEQCLDALSGLIDPGTGVQDPPAHRRSTPIRKRTP